MVLVKPDFCGLGENRFGQHALLIGMGDEVAWEARHFGIRHRPTVRVTAFDRPNRPGR
jgi:hypothetical protein